MRCGGREVAGRSGALMMAPFLLAGGDPSWTDVREPVLDDRKPLALTYSGTCAAPGCSRPWTGTHPDQVGCSLSCAAKIRSAKARRFGRNAP